MQDHAIDDEEMHLLQMLVPTEEQIERGLLIKTSAREYRVTSPATYKADLRALALAKARQIREMEGTL